MGETRSEERQSRAHGGHGKALLVGVGLLAFTTLSYALSHLHLGTWGVVVALAIAAAKAALVAFFFMHLSERSGGPRLVLATAVLFVVILIGLILVEASDRSPAAMPPGPFPLGWSETQADSTAQHRWHQRHHRRAGPHHGAPVHPGPPRGDGGLHGVRSRQVHRRGGRLPGHLGPWELSPKLPDGVIPTTAT